MLTTSRASFGLCICYDLRFVEVMRILALQGAEMMLVPSAWVRGFDRGAFAGSGLPGQLAGVLVQANLNQVFVVGCSVAGPGGRVEFLGRSLVAGPYGDVRGWTFAARPGGRVLRQGRAGPGGRGQPAGCAHYAGADRRRDLYSVTYRGRSL